MDVVRRCMDAYPPNAVWLPAVLEDIQASLGFVPPDAMAMLAAHFRLRRSGLMRLVDNSEAFRATPPAPHQLHVCMGPACAAAGGRALLAEAEAVSGADTSVDCIAGHCLGCCDDAPAVMLDGAVSRRARPEQIRRLLRSLSDAGGG